MTKWLFLKDLRLDCRNQVLAHFFMDSCNEDVDHAKPFRRVDGPEMELKGEIFRLWSLLLT